MNTVETPTVLGTKGPVFSVTRRALFLGGVFSILATAIFFGSFYNRFITIHDNWQSYYAQLMWHGKMPYRDFYYFTQPFSLFLGYVFAGERLVNLRLFGVLERIVLVALLYFLLSRQFSPLASFLGSFVSLMAFTAERLEGFFVYTLDSLVFLVAALVCLYQAYAHSRRQRALLLLVGVFGSLSFFSKQSTGLLATVSLVVLIVWLSTSFQKATQRIAFFSLGWCIPAVPIIWWLWANGAWAPYIQQVFKGAASSKGGLETVLLKSFQLSFPPSTFALFAMLTVIPFIAGWRRRRSFGGPIWVTKDIAIVIVGIFVLTAALLPILIRSSALVVGLMLLYADVFPRVIFLSLIIASIVAVIHRLRAPTPTSEYVATMLVVAGVLWGYSIAMSHSIRPNGILFGVAYLVASACDTLRTKSGRSLLGLVIAFSLLQIGEVALEKFSDPYDWNGWRAKVFWTSTAQSHWPQLRGFHLDKDTVDMFDTVLDDIADNSKPGEPVFTFPTIPLFNFISDRPQPTFCAVFFWDVCPDSVAEADAARVRAARPAVIVDLHLDEWVWKEGEDVFRQGRRSGERSIQEAIVDMTTSGDYQLIHSFETPFYKMPLNVWRRVK